MALLEPGIARIQILHAFVGADPQFLDPPVRRVGVQVLLKSCSSPGTSVAMRLMVEFSIHSSSGDSSTPYLRAKGMVLRKVP
jgi:hypothetical protein